MRENIAAVILFLTSAAVHEAGHYLTARLFSVPCRFIRFCGIGAVLTFDFSRTTYLREAAVHLGGAVFAAVSASLAVIFLGEGAHLYFGITAVLSVINLLPIRGMDGGAALEAVLLPFLLPDTAERIVKILSGCVWVMLWCGVMWIEMRVRANLSLILFILGLMLYKS